MGTALEGGEGDELNTEGGGGGGKLVEQTPTKGEGPKVCRIFYLERFVFTSCLTVTFDPTIFI